MSFSQWAATNACVFPRVEVSSFAEFGGVGLRATTGIPSGTDVVVIPFNLLINFQTGLFCLGGFFFFFSVSRKLFLRLTVFSLQSRIHLSTLVSAFLAFCFGVILKKKVAFSKLCAAVALMSMMSITPYLRLYCMNEARVHEVCGINILNHSRMWLIRRLFGGMMNWSLQRARGCMKRSWPFANKCACFQSDFNLLLQRGQICYRALMPQS